SDLAVPLKSIIEIDVKRPAIRPDQLALIEWFMIHYLTTPDKAIQTIVGNHKLRTTPPIVTSEPSPSSVTLSDIQNRTVSAITSHSGYREFLIHGVTGSGKTEIYLEIARQMKSKGQSAIVLVPEISLTPQVSRIFQERLGQHVAILHSGLTPKQRSTTWNQIYSGEIQIVIGPRSAVFSPLHHLGVIIVDECHDGSYKQDQHPRYDAIQVARQRAKIENIPIVLGSATPTLEQIFATQTGHAHLLSLPHRVMNRPMATTHLLDMRDTSLFPDDTMIGRPLADALRVASAKGEKAIILVNRRGYAPTVVCQKCRNPVTCPQCELGYTYHSDRILRCHRCFTHTPLLSRCPSCHKGTLTLSGIAIQKVELELRKLLPESTIL
ncbi:primosomal protein N', partial [bacterium]|nr:primosomal protein N' [bacterium]